MASPDAKITVERRGQIVLIGINRPQMLNRIDPEAFFTVCQCLSRFRQRPHAPGSGPLWPQRELLPRERCRALFRERWYAPSPG